MSQIPPSGRKGFNNPAYIRHRLDAVLNQAGEHPMVQKPWAGFSATTVLKRSDFNLGQFVPFISDEVNVKISLEAMKAE